MANKRWPKKRRKEIFTLGCHNFGLGQTADGSEITLEMVLAVVREAWRLGMRSFDTATLYRATYWLGRAFEELKIKPEDRVVFTKCLRYLARKRTGMVENQPAELVRCTPYPWNFSTDRWDTSYAGVEQQVANEMFNARVHQFGSPDGRGGVALHDPPDKRLQAGMSWQELEDGALRYLADGQIDGFIGQIGWALKSVDFAHEVLARTSDRPQLRGYIGITSCVTMYHQLMGLIHEARQLGGTDIVLMGIYYGRAGTLSEDPRKAKPFIYNYEVAAPHQRELLGRFWQICDDEGYSLKQLCAAFAGTLIEHYGDVVKRVVIASLKPERLEQNVTMMETERVPPAVMSKLKTEGLIPTDFPEQ